MAVSKRLRFEIFKRDGHKCKYCGRPAPEHPMTVDHVIPVTLGGSDDPANLVTACKDCNSGKSSIPADVALVADVAADALRWSRAMEVVAFGRSVERDEAKERYDTFFQSWNDWYSTNWKGEKVRVELPGDWQRSIDQFIEAGLELDDLIDLTRVAMGAKTNDEWRYFCGCCWRRVQQAQEHAAAIIAQADRPIPNEGLTIHTKWTQEDFDAVIDGTVELARQGNPEFSRASLGAKCEHGVGCADLVCLVTTATALVAYIDSAANRLEAAANAT